MTAVETLQKKQFFPPREQLKGIVETVEVLAYKAMPFAMDHFALECVGECICHCMFSVCLFVCVLLCERPWFFEQSHSLITIIMSSQQNIMSESQGRERQMCAASQSHVVCCAIMWRWYRGGGRKCHLFQPSSHYPPFTFLLFVSQSIFAPLTQLSSCLLESCSLLSPHQPRRQAEFKVPS